MPDDALRRLDALLQISLRLVAKASSGRVALAQLAASLDPAWIPRPAGDEILALLQEAAGSAREPLTTRQVERTLRDAWGARPTDELDDLDPEPVAVTPAAQVHRGTLDGSAVAVKVLRPGLAGAIRQDVALLEAVAAPLASAFPALEAGAVLRELRERVLEELDLESEATVQRRFHRALREHPFLTVPAPVTRLCHEQVMVSEFVEGVPLAEAPDRDGAAARLLAFVLGAAHWGIAYADPHEDNAIVTADGRLAVVDFGACRPVDRERVARAAGVFEALVADDPQGFAAEVCELGWLGEAEAVRLHPLIRAVAAEHLEPGASRLDTEAVIAAQRRLTGRGRELAALLAAGRLAPEEIWPARGVAQVLGTIARVRATGDWTAIARRALREGWDPDPAEG